MIPGGFLVDSLQIPGGFLVTTPCSTTKSSFVNADAITHGVSGGSAAGGVAVAAGAAACHTIVLVDRLASLFTGLPGALKFFLTHMPCS